MKDLYTEDSLLEQPACATRDLLLPRLVSGEVDVSGFEIAG